jgi:hypothetical protein
MQDDEETRKRLQRTNSVIVGLIVASVVAILALFIVLLMN